MIIQLGVLMKPELSIYSGQMSKSLWARSLGCFFNSFIETYTMNCFLPWGQGLISCKGGELLRGVRPWRKGKNVKVNQSCKLDPDLMSPLIHFKELYCDYCSVQDRDSSRKTLAALLRGLWPTVRGFGPCLVLLMSVPGPPCFAEVYPVSEQW